MKKYPRNEEILKEIRSLEINRAIRIPIAGASSNIQRIITITARRRGIVLKTLKINENVLMVMRLS